MIHIHGEIVVVIPNAYSNIAEIHTLN